MFHWGTYSTQALPDCWYAGYDHLCLFVRHLCSINSAWLTQPLESAHTCGAWRLEDAYCDVCCARCARCAHPSKAPGFFMHSYCHMCCARCARSAHPSKAPGKPAKMAWMPCIHASLYPCTASTHLSMVNIAEGKCAKLAWRLMPDPPSMSLMLPKRFMPTIIQR